MRLCTLNEFFNNKGSASENANDIMKIIGVEDYKLDIKQLDDNAFIVIVRLKGLEKNEADLIERNINKYQPMIFKDFVWIDYKRESDTFDSGLYRLDIVIKKLNQGETNAPNFVYHFSPKKNRENIKMHGIFPYQHKEGKWRNDIQLSYPPSIFVSQDKDNGFYSERDYDIWKIDTNKIDNKFYLDVNEPYKDSLMTMKKIPVHAVELV